jgi:CHAT domain-containing protein
MLMLTPPPEVRSLDNEKEANDLPIRENLIDAFRAGYDIVHYSGHAFFDNVLPGRSGILLRNGVLTASDVRFMLDLNRNPIIYANACSAGRIKSVSSRFTGLAAAFIRAGAMGYKPPLEYR